MSNPGLVIRADLHHHHNHNQHQQQQQQKRSLSASPDHNISNVHHVLHSQIPPNPSTNPTPAAAAAPSRYESQKRRDWNTFGQYLKNHRPPLALSRCSGAHVLEFLRYLDQFGKTKIHNQACPFFGHPMPPAPCPCPLRQAWGSLDALIGRLRAAYEENGGQPEENPFGARAVRLYLREVREMQAKARGIAYEKKKRKPLVKQSTSSSSSSTSSSSSSMPMMVSTSQAPQLSHQLGIGHQGYYHHHELLMGAANFKMDDGHGGGSGGNGGGPTMVVRSSSGGGMIPLSVLN